MTDKILRVASWVSLSRVVAKESTCNDAQEKHKMKRKLKASYLQRNKITDSYRWTIFASIPHPER